MCCVCCVKERHILGEFMLNYLSKITLPISVANKLGHVFVANGTLQMQGQT